MSVLESVKRVFGGGLEKKSIPLSDPAIAEIFGYSPTLSGTVVNSLTAIQNPAVLQAVRLISETIGSLPCKLYSETSESKQASKDHDAYALVHSRVNPWTSAGQLRADLTTDALLHGAGYAEVVRIANDRPAELHRLLPGTVQRRLSNDGEPFYIVTSNGQAVRRLSYRDVLYISAFGGVAPVHAGRKAIGLAMTLERHGEQFFASGARPSGVISNDKATGTEGGAKTITNILKQWRAWQSNAGGDPLILDSGWKFEQPTMTSTDAQFIENRLEQINEIARIFGVPPSMLFQLDRATWSNAEQMAASFLQLCLRPWLDRWQDAYATVLLTEAEQRAFYFEFVIDDLQRADAAGRAEIFGKLVAMRAMTPNEVRAAMNLPAIEGGDSLANPYTTPGNAAPVTDSTE